MYGQTTEDEQQSWYMVRGFNGSIRVRGFNGAIMVRGFNDLLNPRKSWYEGLRINHGTRV